MLLKYQDDIAKIRGAEAARLVGEAQAAAAPRPVRSERCAVPDGRHRLRRPTSCTSPGCCAAPGCRSARPTCWPRSRRWRWWTSAAAPQVRTALRATMVHRHEHEDLFEQAFRHVLARSRGSQGRQRRWRCWAASSRRRRRRRPAAAGWPRRWPRRASSATAARTRSSEIDAVLTVSEQRAAADDGFRGDERRRDRPGQGRDPPADACRSTCGAPAGGGPTRPARTSTCAPPSAPACARAAKSCDIARQPAASPARRRWWCCATSAAR